MSEKIHPKTLIVIPARGGSKRLFRKNIQLVLGVPMVVRVANEAKKCEVKPRVVVSTEDAEIKSICESHGVEVVDRPIELANDETTKMAAIEHAVTYLHQQEGFKPEIVVSLQANSPEFEAKHLDESIHFFLNDLYPGYPIKEVWSIGKDMIQNGAFRVMTFATVYHRTLSTYTGVRIYDYLDVHTKEDLDEVEKRILARNRN